MLSANVSVSVSVSRYVLGRSDVVVVDSCKLRNPGGCQSIKDQNGQSEAEKQILFWHYSGAQAGMAGGVEPRTSVVTITVADSRNLALHFNQL